MMLSKESKEFLGNLRAYLLSTGKNEKESLEIVEELESHLIEAEANGKSVEDIIGKSPKEYMESIADEMDFDGKQVFMTGVFIILGAFSIFILPEVIRGVITGSLFKLISMLVIMFIETGAIAWIIRKISKENIPERKALLYLIPIIVFPLFAFIGIFLLDDRIPSPMMTLEGLPVYLIGVLALAILVGIAIWSKSWMMIIVIAVITLPDLLQKVFHYSDLVSAYIFTVLLILLTVGIFISNRRMMK